MVLLPLVVFVLLLLFQLYLLPPLRAVIHCSAPKFCAADHAP
jgi:hypothetical protein